MPKIPGSPGDVSRRRDRGRTHTAGSANWDVIDLEAIPAGWPKPEESWHPRATEIYWAASVSPQSVLYAQTDIARLRLACDLVSDALQNPGRGMAAKLEVADSILASLLFSVADRRKLRIELTTSDPDPERPAWEIAAEELFKQLEEG